MYDFCFTLWDVDHGIAIWVRTPNGKNHLIDVGSKSSNVGEIYRLMHDEANVNDIDLLFISHPDRDHIEGLPQLIENIGEPKSIIYNSSYINNFSFSSNELSYDYAKTFTELKNKFLYQIEWSDSQLSPQNNGNIEIKYFYNNFTQNNQISSNNSSLIVIYKYKNFVFICPGDIEQSGWLAIQKNYAREILDFVSNSTIFMIAPHHGRETAYNDVMIDFFNPDLILISDKYGSQGKTDSRYYSAANGLWIDNVKVKLLSTKTKGTIFISIDQFGLLNVGTED